MTFYEGTKLVSRFRNKNLREKKKKKLRFQKDNLRFPPSISRLFKPSLRSERFSILEWCFWFAASAFILQSTLVVPPAWNPDSAAQWPCSALFYIRWLIETWRGQHSQHPQAQFPLTPSRQMFPPDAALTPYIGEWVVLMSDHNRPFGYMSLAPPPLRIFHSRAAGRQSVGCRFGVLKHPGGCSLLWLWVWQQHWKVWTTGAAYYPHFCVL